MPPYLREEPLSLVCFGAANQVVWHRQISITSLRLDGPGEVVPSTVNAGRARVWCDKSGNWLQAMNESLVFLNSLPLSPRAKLILRPGDRLFLGRSKLERELIIASAAMLERFRPAANEAEYGEASKAVSLQGVAEGNGQTIRFPDGDRSNTELPNGKSASAKNGSVKEANIRKVDESELEGEDSEANDLSAKPRGANSGPVELAPYGESFRLLTRAEFEIVAWMSRGVVEFDELQTWLGRSVNTVRTQLSLVYRKLGVNSRAELLGLLLRQHSDLARQRSGCNAGFELGRGPSASSPVDLEVRRETQLAKNSHE